MNGGDILGALASGGAGVGVGFWGLIRWVQGGLAKKVDKALFDERTENIQADVSEIKGTMAGLHTMMGAQGTNIALIHQSIQNIEARARNTRTGD